MSKRRGVLFRFVCCFLFCASFTFQSVADLPVTLVHVFLQGGQSNADGRADPTELPAIPINLQGHQEDVDFYYKSSLTALYPATSGGTQFGPEITCGRHLVDLMKPPASERVAIIKYAFGGTSLYSDWIAGGNSTTNGDGLRYITFQSTVTKGMSALALAYPDAEIAIDGMIWMQGESDVPTASAAYYANLTNFIADVRLTYSLPQLPFIIGRLSSGQTGAGNATLLNVVRQAQTDVAAADPWAGLVDTDIFQLKSDKLHFDAAGQQSLGDAFAEALLVLIGGGDAPPRLISLDWTVSSGGFSVVTTVSNQQTCILESSTNLMSDVWSAVITNKASEDGLLTLTDPLVLTNQSRFYRVLYK